MLNNEAIVRVIDIHYNHVQNSFLALPGEPPLHAAIALQMLNGLLRTHSMIEEHKASLPDTTREDIQRKLESLGYPVEKLQAYFTGIKDGTSSSHYIDRQTAAIFLFYIGHQYREIGELLQR